MENLENSENVRKTPFYLSILEFEVISSSKLSHAECRHHTFESSLFKLNGTSAVRWHSELFHTAVEFKEFSNIYASMNHLLFRLPN